MSTNVGALLSLMTTGRDTSIVFLYKYHAQLAEQTSARDVISRARVASDSYLYSSYLYYTALIALPAKADLPPPPLDLTSAI